MCSVCLFVILMENAEEKKQRFQVQIHQSTSHLTYVHLITMSLVVMEYCGNDLDA